MKSIMLKLDGRKGNVNISEIYDYINALNRNFNHNDIGEVLDYASYTKHFSTNYNLKVINVNSKEVWIQII